MPLVISFAGDISFLGGMFFEADSDLNGDTPQFTLVSHSIGGPATIVTWTRNSEVISAGVTTELYDYVTAHYVHRLTITGRRGGLYECTVSNQKPSIASVTYYMQGDYVVYNFEIIILLYIKHTLHTNCIVVTISA